MQHPRFKTGDRVTVRKHTTEEKKKKKLSKWLESKYG